MIGVFQPHGFLLLNDFLFLTIKKRKLGLILLVDEKASLISTLNTLSAGFTFCRYNVCIMAYGQTGSGKTHTMLGDHSLDSDVNEEGVPDETKEGIIPKSGRELFGYESGFYPIHFFS